MKKKKIWAKKNLGKKKIWVKKNLIKKILGKKKIWVKKIDAKRVITPKGAPKLPQIGLSFLSGGDTQRIMCTVQKGLQMCPKRNLVEKLAPFMTDRTFWDPKLPHSHRPI